MFSPQLTQAVALARQSDMMRTAERERRARSAAVRPPRWQQALGGLAAAVAPSRAPHRAPSPAVEPAA